MTQHEHARGGSERWPSKQDKQGTLFFAHWTSSLGDVEHEPKLLCQRRTKGKVSGRRPKDRGVARCPRRQNPLEGRWYASAGRRHPALSRVPR